MLPCRGLNRGPKNDHTVNETHIYQVQMHQAEIVNMLVLSQHVTFHLTARLVILPCRAYYGEVSDIWLSRSQTHRKRSVQMLMETEIDTQTWLGPASREITVAPLKTTAMSSEATPPKSCNADHLFETYPDVVISLRKKQARMTGVAISIREHHFQHVRTIVLFPIADHPRHM